MNNEYVVSTSAPQRYQTHYQRQYLYDGNDKEGEGEDGYPEEDGWEDHADNIGDDEEKSGHQPRQQEPARPWTGTTFCYIIPLIQVLK